MCTTLSWEYRDQCASQLGKHAKVDRQVKAAWVAGWVGALRRQEVLHGAGCRKGGDMMMMTMTMMMTVMMTLVLVIGVWQCWVWW